MLIIASLVEREAQLDKERPLIASVIYNRLQDGMPLGIDATIRYETRNWQRPIRQSELDARHAVQHAPAPRPAADADRQPGPEVDQGRRATRRKTNYLFFVRKPGKTGAHAFSSTNAQFDRDSARYQASREP